jgi:dishevelled associated activator of morphogenesis
VTIHFKALKSGTAWYDLGSGQLQIELSLTPNGFAALSKTSKPIPISPAELERRFGELVKNLAITNEAQRDAMFAMPAEMKWNMLKQSEKEASAATGRIEDKPEYWTNRLAAEPSKGLLAELRVLLSTSPLSWLERFVELNGIVLLVGVLAKIEQKAVSHVDDKRYRHTADELEIEAECVRCLRMIMNNELGLRAVLRTPAAVQSLCLALDSNGMDPRVKSTILKLLTVTCMMPPDGHRNLLLAMNEYRLIKNDKQRFNGLIKALKKATTVEQQLGYMYLINALINSPADIDLRVAIRSEFTRLGLPEVIARLKQAGDPELELQLDVFEEETTLDDNEVKERFQGIDIDVDDPDEVFTALRAKLKDTGLSETLQSILRNLLLIPPDSVDGQKLWLLVARFVRQVSVQREAIGATDDNEIQLDALLVTVADEAANIDKAAEIERLRSQLKDLTAKHAALQSEAADQLKLLEAKDALLKSGGAGGAGVKLDGSVATQGTTGEIKLPASGDDAPITGGPPIGAPMPPPMMGGGGGGGDDAPVVGGPPPPPPMMGGGGGGGGPGMPPPPPMMAVKKFKWKLTPDPKTKLKGFQWVKMNPKDADKTIFKKFQETPLENFKFDFQELEAEFAVAAPSAKASGAKAAKEENATVNLLEGKVSQNLSIWLSQYKNKTTSELTRAMMSLDSTLFTPASIKTLLTTLPGKDGERAVQAYLTDGGDAKRLDAPEKFTLELAKVPALEALLSAFLFMLEFEAQASDVRPAIEAVRLASREVFASKRFSRLLQVVMHLGNFLNGTTARGDAPGFKLESLNKIEDTKTSDNKRTLLYYLVGKVKEQDPQLLQWADDLKNVYAAARVALPQMTLDVKQLKDGIAAVKEAKAAMPAEHRSLHTKFEAFLLKAEEAVEKLAADKDKMEKQYVKMAEQFGVDGEKMLPDEFFGMIQTFADRFAASVKQLELEADRLTKETKREAAKAAKLAEFQKAKAEIKIAKKKPKKAAAGADDDAVGKASADDDDNGAVGVGSGGGGGGGGDDDDDDAPKSSMFDSMMNSLQAGEAFQDRRKSRGSALKGASPASKKKGSALRAADMD